MHTKHASFVGACALFGLVNIHERKTDRFWTFSWIEMRNLPASKIARRALCHDHEIFFHFRKSTTLKSHQSSSPRWSITIMLVRYFQSKQKSATATNWKPEDLNIFYKSSAGFQHEFHMKFVVPFVQFEMIFRQTSHACVVLVTVKKNSKLNVWLRINYTRTLKCTLFFYFVCSFSYIYQIRNETENSKSVMILLSLVCAAHKRFCVISIYKTVVKPRTSVRLWTKNA